MIKAITAAVIAILKLNIRFRPLAQAAREQKEIAVKLPRGLWWPTVCQVAEEVKAIRAPFARLSSLLTPAKLRL